MRKPILLLAILAAPAFAAGQALLDLAMPDAQVLFGVSVERVRSSRLAQFIWSQLPQKQPDLSKLIEAGGLDPLRQISEILVSVPPKSRPQRVLLGVRGSFDRSRLSSLLSAHGAYVEMHHGVEILSMKQKGQVMALAVLDELTLIGGDPASVRDSVARRGLRSRISPALQQQAAALSSELDIWFASTAPVSELMRNVPNSKVSGTIQGDPLKGIEQVSGGIRLGLDLELRFTAVTRSEQDANSLANVIRFFVGMARSRQQQVQPPLAESINVAGNTLNVSLTVPEAEIEKMILAAGKPPAQAAEPTGITIHSSPADMGVVKLPPPK